jgi:NAD(P)-dependent dehydrogenase (short-subunit alcohol dehydrogenase family)
MSGNYLEGKVVVVTGGGSGIGQSVADVCSELGAKVAICDLNVGSTSSDDNRLVYECDVTRPETVDKAFAKVKATLGAVDAVVNCAGIWRPRSDGPITAVTDDTWDQVIAVNLTGTFNVCRSAVRIMEEQGSGSIVTIASVVAITGWEKLNSYSASKGGVLALSRALAVECGPKNIRVNCICPGVIETPMTEKVLAYSKPDVLPIGRLGQPRDIAHTAAFLCSDRSAFTTASTVVVDGGFSAA